jgi:large subunit ribosomal protein L15
MCHLTKNKEVQKMKLGELRPAVEKKDRKRLGRGIGSGNGKTAGKGHKGQNARSGGGVRRGFEGGQTPLYRRLPKRGFTNRNSKNYTEVTLTMLNKSKATDVTAESLVEEGIIGKINDGIVVLATGKLEKKLNVKANRFTATAKEKIEALGGKAEVI